MRFTICYDLNGRKQFCLYSEQMDLLTDDYSLPGGHNCNQNGRYIFVKKKVLLPIFWLFNPVSSRAPNHQTTLLWSPCTQRLYFLCSHKRLCVGRNPWWPAVGGSDQMAENLILGSEDPTFRWFKYLQRRLSWSNDELVSIPRCVVLIMNFKSSTIKQLSWIEVVFWSGSQDFTT